MKKIININLAGRVIPIEDSAFESLQRYIESLRRYFANEEGRDEIINDIESRIAELMNDRIKKGATAVTDADIDQIIASMGRIEDFEQTDAAESANEQTSGASSTAYSKQSSSRPRGRLYRDTSDKILGGVCSGIANYFNVDPAIVRVLFALLVFGAGTGVLIYILLWIILPARPGIQEPAPRIGKRFFRNPDDRIIGGVAGGLGAYFNREAWIFRLIFAAPLLLNILFATLNGVFFAFHRGDGMFPTFFIGSFTGTFIIAYIVLWIILPEARTPYEKMEMRGEKVDVNTIKQNVQEGMSDFKTRMQNWSEEVKSSAQNLSDRARETFGGAKGKQFASDVSQSATRVGNSFGHVLGVMIKAFFLFVAGSIAFALFIVLIVLIFGGGFAIGEKQHIMNFFLSGFWQHAFFWGTVIFFFLVPVIGFITWFVRRIVKIRSRRHYLSYVFGGLWFIGFISVCCLAASLISDFRRGEIKTDPVAISQPQKGRMIVTVNEPEINYSGDLWFVDTNAGWDITEDTLKLSDIRVRVAKSEDSSYSVTVQRYGRGRTTAEAMNRAEKIVYNVNSKDSFLLLGSGFAIDRDSKYRAQRVVVEIKVPVGKKINFNESVLDNLNHFNVVRIGNRFGSRRYRRNSDWDWNDDEYFAWKTGVDYVMTAGGTLQEANAPDETTPTNTDKKDSSKKSKGSTSFYKQEQKKAIPISVPLVPSIILVEGFS